MTHKHHIIPRHEWKQRFGNLVGFNALDNTVWLTIEQHTQAHQFLYELFGNEYDRIAFQALAGMIGREDAITHAQKVAARRPKSSACRKKMSLSHKQLYKKYGHHLLGVPKSRETCRKMAQTKELRGPWWVVKTPAGRIETIKNLARYCRENGLANSSMCHVAKGNMVVHRGFHCTKGITV